jgi:small subunit ribosomal protein S3
LGQKVDPRGFRLGIVRDWDARWYAEKDYAKFLQQDLRMRGMVKRKCSNGYVARVEIERISGEVLVTIYSSRPGILIGRGGQNVEILKADMEKLIGEKVRLTIKEVENPEVEATLVARNIAERLEGRVTFRWAMKQTAGRTMQAGALGVKIKCAGRLGGQEIARSETLRLGRVPLHTLRANIDYGFSEAHTAMGRIGVKVWIYKGDILPEERKSGVTAEEGEAS